ncbi:MAG: hypothetical protein GY806_17670 [Gammaproteobacteria bacterium]|nr:hypothetical protein [Gammaproteobacteria bacterium]
MLKGTVETGRVVINEYPEGLEIIIPSQKSTFASGFLTIWLLAWSYGEIFIFNKIINGPEASTDAFIVFWLCAWTLGGMLAIFLLMWNTKGREIIRIDDKELWRSREYVWFSRSGRYQLNDIQNLRLNEIDLSRPDIDQSEFWGITGGSITFDYGHCTEKLARELDQEDASELIDLLKARYPIA